MSATKPTNSSRSSATRHQPMSPRNPHLRPAWRPCLAGLVVTTCLVLAGCGKTATVDTSARDTGDGTTASAGEAAVKSPTGDTTVTEADLEACQAAIAATPIWAGADRTPPTEVGQVADGSIGTVVGSLVRVEAGPVERTDLVDDPEVRAVVPGGIQNASTRFVVEVEDAHGDVSGSVHAGRDVGVLVPTIVGSTDSIEHRDVIDKRVRDACPEGVKVAVYVKSVDETGDGVDLAPMQLAGVLLEAPDGSIRSLDAAVAGPEPFGLTTSSAFLAA